MTPRSCPHTPPCPAAEAPDHDAARLLSAHPEQGWTLLCNGVVVFDDTGELLPDGRVVAPHRPRCRIPAPRAADRARLGLTLVPAGPGCGAAPGSGRSST